MSDTLSVKDLLILVDGQNFISHIRKLFREEFDEEDYLPRNAQWSLLFRSIKKMLGAENVQIYWYTIKSLDYSPHVDWSQEDLEEFSDEHFHTWRNYLIRNHASELKERRRPVTPAEWEFLEAKDSDERKEAVERWRKNCQVNHTIMEERLEEWHQLQDEIVEQYPKVQIERIGWQFCKLVNRKLGPEKGVDIGLASDLILKEDEYDTALIFSSDGDYVPAIAAMQGKGKRIGHVEFLFRTGEPLRGTSRHLSAVCDFTLEIPWPELKTFLGMPDHPVEKRRNERRAREKREKERRYRDHNKTRAGKKTR
ncbi:MAG: NYN domain-containing protein [Verrucomicrobiales bacterium]|nr:NYN domain-containing protein [Verrucomicrobiales bacterium]